MTRRSLILVGFLLTLAQFWIDYTKISLFDLPLLSSTNDSNSNNSTLLSSTDDRNSRKSTNETIAIPQSEEVTHHGQGQTLPSFAHGNGGVILFYHVAKTGGTTVRSIFQKKAQHGFTYMRYSCASGLKKKGSNSTLNTNECFARDWCKMQFAKLTETIQLALSKTPKHQPTLLLEIHGGLPGLDVIVRYIQKWRDQSAESGKPFFAFTLVREPIAFSVSYFKAFHVNCNWVWCEKFAKTSSYSPQALMDSLISNRQCFFLHYLSAVQGMKPHFYKCARTRDQCIELYGRLANTLDWIGTTENLSYDTIPILQHLLYGPRVVNKNSTRSDGVDQQPHKHRLRPVPNVTSQNVARTGGWESNLPAVVTERIQNMTDGDQFLFDSVNQEFHFDSTKGKIERRISQLGTEVIGGDTSF